MTKGGQGVEELLSIGKILKPHGIRGEVKVLPLTDFPRRFDRLSHIQVLTADHRLLDLTIQKVRYYKNFVYLKFKEYTSVDQVKGLRGGLLKIKRSEAVELPEGQYLYFDIIGLSVRTEAGEELGVVEDIFSTGGNDVYVVKSQKNKEYLIPATTEIIKKIDLVEKVLIIHPLEGLLS
jgi:16S rRNA processing protein RimM